MHLWEEKLQRFCVFAFSLIIQRPVLDVSTIRYKQFRGIQNAQPLNVAAPETQLPAKTAMAKQIVDLTAPTHCGCPVAP